MLAWAEVPVPAKPLTGSLELLDIDGANIGMGIGIIDMPMPPDREVVLEVELEVELWAAASRSMTRTDRHAKLAQATLRGKPFMAWYRELAAAARAGRGTGCQSNKKAPPV